MAKKNLDITALGQAMDGTFGRSTASYGPVISTHSVKASMVGTDRVKVMYMTAVNLVRDKNIVEMTTMYEKEADSLIEAAVKNISGDYKELSGSSVKFKRLSVNSTLEVIDLNIYNNKRTAYLRRVAIFEIS